MLYVISVPLIDFDEFIIRIKEMPNMIMATRRALKNDDWETAPDPVERDFKFLHKNIDSENSVKNSSEEKELLEKKSPDEVRI